MDTALLRAIKRRCNRRWRSFLLAGAAVLLAGITAGCAALSNPVADGVPVRRLPPEVFGPSKDEEKPLPLALLRQKPPEVYRLDKGDVLGVWIEGVLGELKTPPPVRYSDLGNLPPSIGYPLPVRDDGTLPLPLIPPVKVKGLSLAEVQAEIIKAYTVTRQILKPGQDRIVVTLVRPRQYHVLVLREDAGTATLGATGGYGTTAGGTTVTETRRAAGFPLDLPAYENDVLNALTRSGGLPGFDAENEIRIERGAYQPGAGDLDGSRIMEPLPLGDRCSPHDPFQEGQPTGVQTIRIPLRTRPGEQPTFRPEDVVLHNGDVVVVKARRGELFYTGGLLPPRAFPLPRDRDLDVVEAIALVGGPLLNGGTNANNLVGTLITSGLGAPSPSLITIVRKTHEGGQIPIRVSLNQALRDPRERVRILPGDVIILQESPTEAITRYITTNLRFNFLATIINQRDLFGTATLNVP
jgi:protein involved in polysaccharide export with SLBB domain